MSIKYSDSSIAKFKCFFTPPSPFLELKGFGFNLQPLSVKCLVYIESKVTELVYVDSKATEHLPFSWLWRAEFYQKPGEENLCFEEVMS